MNTLTVRRGATLPLEVTIDDLTADTATLIVKLDEHDSTPVITKTANFVAGVADLTLTDTDTTIESTEYIYQITVEYLDGTIEKYPEADDCDDECGFPQFIVCEALDSYEVS